MGLLIIHVTDAHLDEASKSFVDRANAIVDAALSPMIGVNGVHIVLSGDLANRTAPRDFDIAKALIFAITKRIKERIGVDARVLTVAGNHDCDFSGDQSVRDALLPVARSKPAEITNSILGVISSVLEGFYKFQAEVSPDSQKINSWLSVASFPDDRVRYILLNSAVMSTKREDPGKLFVPLPEIDEGDGMKTIFVMHHPFGWLVPDNARELAQQASMAGDLFLMGHEHELWAQQVNDLYDESAITFLRGHVLRDEQDDQNSAFETVLLDFKKGFLPRSYIWRDGVYEPWVEKSKEEFVGWPTSNGSRKLAISPSGYKYLNSAGANFSHRRKDVITLQDIYVWPTLKRFKPEKDTGNLVADGLGVNADMLLDVDDRTPVCVIKGNEQSGKTALSKILSIQLSRRGTYPLLLDASSISSWREKGLQERIDGAIDLLYGKRWRNEYMKLDPKDRALILDDFDLAQVEKGCLEGLRALRQHFGHVYLMLDSYPGADFALNEFLSDENFVDSEIFEINPSTHHHRLEIIERWLLIGSDSDTSVDELKLTAAKLLKVVDETLGRNLIPAAPIFVLIILQRAELAQDLNTVVKSGSHGFLYESLITQALSTRVTDCTVVTSIAYLTAFAKACEQSDRDGLTQVDYEQFHVDHCRRFNLKLSVNSLQKQLVGAEILDDRSSSGVRFKYPYHFYYFFARSISQISDWTALEPRIDALVKSIHTERSANVLLFLAHLGRNPKVAYKILVSAGSMFADYKEADLFAAGNVVERFKSMEIRQILFEGTKAQQLEEHSQDERDAERSAKELAEVAEARLKARLADALLMNAAFKSLQVLGQVLRNHAGEIERDEKDVMAECCVSLGLRVLSFLNETIEKHGEEMLIFRGLQIRADRSSTVSDVELAAELETYLPSMISNITVGTLIKIANAIGSEDLAPTIDDVLASNSTRKLLRLVAHLEHFADFPRKALLDFEEDTLRNGPVLPNSVLRRFIIRRFYLFPVREELKRAVLDRFKIKALPFKFLEQRRLGKQ